MEIFSDNISFVATQTSSERGSALKFKKSKIKTKKHQSVDF
jgi:hypothetical protein